MANDFVSDGANLMIEVMKLAQEKLAELLDGRKLRMPRTIVFQADSCRSNKNKTVFAYLSHLVQEKVYDTIHFNFLMVGHTHCSIDQYFSVLSTRICQNLYILSPMSMVDLLMGAHKRVEQQPICFHWITAVHDWTSFYKPFLCTVLSGHSFARRYRLQIFGGRPCCQYLMSSPVREDDAIWLPEHPDLSADEVLDLNKHLIECSVIPHATLDSVGGEEELRSFLELPSTSDGFFNQKAQRAVGAYMATRQSIIDLELKAFSEMCSRSDEEEVGRFAPRYSNVANTPQALKAVAKIFSSKITKLKGVIVWVDVSKMNLEGKFLHEVAPGFVDDVDAAELDEAIPPASRSVTMKKLIEIAATVVGVSSFMLAQVSCACS